MKISINKARKLWDKYYLIESLKNHSKIVAKVATFLSQKYLEKELITKDQQIRIIIAALLHDLMKPICRFVDFDYASKKFKYTDQQIEFWKKLKQKHPEMTHEELAHEELKHDYLRIADIIKVHGFWFNTKDDNVCNMILGYSDLRSGRDEVFTIEKRVLDLHIRYKNLNKTIKDWISAINQDEKLLKLEKRLLEKINIKPVELLELNNITLEELFKQHNIDKELEIEG